MRITDISANADMQNFDLARYAISAVISAAVLSELLTVRVLKLEPSTNRNLACSYIQTGITGDHNTTLFLDASSKMIGTASQSYTVCEPRCQTSVRRAHVRC